MAKHRHRIFEIYEHRDEAIHALAPKTVEADEVKSRATVSSSFSHLSVSRAGFVTHVRFKGTTAFPEEAEGELREDLYKLAEVLEIDSKVLLDFTDVESFSPGCISALVVFEREVTEPGQQDGALFPCSKYTCVFLRTTLKAKWPVPTDLPVNIVLAWLIVVVCAIFVFFYLARHLHLFRCPHCRMRRSFRAERCPHCGNNLRW